MSDLKKANVQYNDMEGSAALDFHGSFSELRDYAKDKGIDLEKYEPIGLDIYYGEIDSFYLTFIVVDKINKENYVLKHGRIPVLEISVEENQKDFERRFKRFNIKLTLQGKKYSDFDLIDSIHLKDLDEES